MNQNFNYNKQVSVKNQAYRYREYWIDPQMGRPWTYLEERLMNHFVQDPHEVFHSNFIWSTTFKLFWPEFLVRKAASAFLKAGYLSKEEPMYYEDAYRLTNFGQCMVSKKRAYEM